MSFKIKLFIIFFTTINMACSQQYFADYINEFQIKVPEKWATVILDKPNDEGIFRVMFFENIKEPKISNFNIYINNEYKSDIEENTSDYIKKFKETLGKYDVTIEGKLIKEKNFSAIQILTSKKGISTYLVPFNKKLFVFNFNIENKDENFKLEIVKSLSVIE